MANNLYALISTEITVPAWDASGGTRKEQRTYEVWELGERHAHMVSSNSAGDHIWPLSKLDTCKDLKLSGRPERYTWRLDSEGGGLIYYGVSFNDIKRFIETSLQRKITEVVK